MKAITSTVQVSAVGPEREDNQKSYTFKVEMTMLSSGEWPEDREEAINLLVTTLANQLREVDAAPYAPKA